MSSLLAQNLEAWPGSNWACLRMRPGGVWNPLKNVGNFILISFLVLWKGVGHALPPLGVKLRACKKEKDKGSVVKDKNE